MPVSLEEHGGVDRPTLYEYRPLVGAFVEVRAGWLGEREDALAALAAALLATLLAALLAAALLTTTLTASLLAALLATARSAALLFAFFVVCHLQVPFC